MHIPISKDLVEEGAHCICVNTGIYCSKKQKYEKDQIKHRLHVLIIPIELRHTLRGIMNALDWRGQWTVCDIV
jgi:hypothetical protein